jgi:RAQPRD family integrative conjugative element protein
MGELNMHFLKIISITILTVSMMLISVISFADSVQEKTDLARISNILNAAYPLIDDAQRQAISNTRVEFRYDWLRKDIQAIQAGIAEKINMSKVEPRVVTPLKTQYVEQQNTHE